MISVPPSPTVRVQELGTAGAALLCALHMRAFAADTGERWRADDLSEVLQAPGCRCLVAVAGETPLGYALLRLVADECELLSIGVAPEVRRRGIGKQLMAAARDLCRARGVKTLFLEVREGNKAARRFYRTQAFVEVGRRRNYYRHNCGRWEDAITMSRRFTQDCSSTGHLT